MQDEKVRRSRRAERGGTKADRLRALVEERRAGKWAASDDYVEALRAASEVAGFDLLGVEHYACGGATHDVARFEHEVTGLVFHLLPGGRYRRGGTKYGEEQPIVEVTVPSFLVCATPCTQRAWERVMGSNPSHFKSDNRPVERVSWEDVQEFSGKTGLRLPSEAEWEYACRAGTTSEYCFGDDEGSLGEYAWYRDNSGRETHPVAEKKPNAFGLHDVHGNVWEWVQDTYADSYAGAPTDGSAREDAGASYRVGRGGSWYRTASYCRSALRNRSSPGNRRHYLGFRPARSLP